jgi:competence protein ComEA
VLKLRTEFGVRQGTKGKLLYVPQPGGTQRAMYWSEFVTLAFGVSERHMNRLLGIPADPKEGLDPKKSKNYKLGFVDGQAAARRGPVPVPAQAQPASKLAIRGVALVVFLRYLSTLCEQVATPSQSTTASPREPLRDTRGDSRDGDEPSAVALIFHPFASKGYVRRQTAPIRDRVNELEEITVAHGNQIKDTDGRAPGRCRTRWYVTWCSIMRSRPAASTWPRGIDELCLNSPSGRQRYNRPHSVLGVWEAKTFVVTENRKTTYWRALKIQCLCLLLAGWTACVQKQNPDELREKTAETTAEVKRDAKAVVAGVREGWSKDKLLELNSASRDQLLTLPGITAKQADRIIAGRPYDTAHELVTHRVLSTSEYDKIKDRITAKH